MSEYMTASEILMRNEEYWMRKNLEIDRIRGRIMDTLITRTFTRLMPHLHEEKMFKMYGHRRNNYLFPTQQADRAWLGVDMVYGEDTPAGRLIP